MNVQWANDLKHHTRELSEQIRRFFQDFPLQNPPYTRYAERLLPILDAYERWTGLMPEADDTDVMPWVNWAIALHDARSLLVTIRGYFEIQLMVHEKHHTLSQRVKDRAEMIHHQLHRISDLHAEPYDLSASFWRSAEADPVILSAYTVLAATWPLIHPWSVKRELKDMARGVRDWPRVLYHPYHTSNLLITCMTRLMRRLGERENTNLQSFYLVPYKTEAFFEMHLTETELSMTPLFWEELLTQLRENDTLEALRTLGGDLQPLVWDEGYGQGVIVQLPWAQS